MLVGFWKHVWGNWIIKLYVNQLLLLLNKKFFCSEQTPTFYINFWCTIYFSHIWTICFTPVHFSSVKRERFSARNWSDSDLKRLLLAVNSQVGQWQHHHDYFETRAHLHNTFMLLCVCIRVVDFKSFVFCLTGR